MTGERELEAVRQAARAVAAAMRGRAWPADAAAGGLGPFDLWFITYAGAWAVALHRYTNEAGDGPGPSDDDVAVLAAAEAEWIELMRGVPCADGHPPPPAELPRMYRAFTVPWQRALSREWPVIRDLAARLARGETVGDREVRARMGAGGATLEA